ncbi:hypothetical protein [Roseateles sp. P5_D6]
MLVVLGLIAVASAGLALASSRYTAQVQRDKEQELLTVGRMYASALQRYYDSAPGNLKRYPNSLEWLTRDPRYVGVVRYLRKVHPDPLQPNNHWGLAIDTNGGIVGVFSINHAQPLGPASTLAPVPDAQHYSDWIFLADPTLTDFTLSTTGAPP